MVYEYKYINFKDLEELAVLKFIVVQGTNLTFRELDCRGRHQILVALYNNIYNQLDATIKVY